MSVIVAFSLVKVTVEPQPVVTDTDQADSVVPTTSFPFFLVGSLYLANSTSVVLQILFKKSASSVVKLWGSLSQPLMGGALLLTPFITASLLQLEEPPQSVSHKLLNKITIKAKPFLAWNLRVNMVDTLRSLLLL